MIDDSQLVELESYRSAEEHLQLQERPSFGSLVVASGNSEAPVHRWFRFKEAYSPKLLQTLLSTFYGPSSSTLQLVDPYCGVGTTLLSAQTLRDYRVQAIGIEHNPFIRFIAQAKLDWHKADAKNILKLAKRIVDAPIAQTSALPNLSGLTSGRCMSTHIGRRLVGIREAIRNDGDSINHRLLLVGLASAIEPLSRTRKDGRALRLVDRPRQLVSAILMRQWSDIAADISLMKKANRSVNVAKVIAGDGRRPTNSGIGIQSIDAIVTSPPYPNNIDYSEVYKLELWLLDFIKDAKNFLALRKGTFRSHPTSDLKKDESLFLKTVFASPLSAIFEPLLNKLDTEAEKWRRKLLIGYFSDMLLALEEYYKILRTGGQAFIAVGNSLHGGQYASYLIATDLLVAELAKTVGFNVSEVAISRPLRRRLTGNHFLRDSIVVLRK